MIRRIKGLRWVRASSRPQGLPQRRPRGAKARGLAFERDFAKALPPGALHGPWLEFEDANGHGFAQPDYVTRHEGQLIVWECKYTWTSEGHQQLEWLYLPLLEAFAPHLKAPRGLVVARRLVLGCPVQIEAQLERAVESAIAGRRTCLHWPMTRSVALAA